MPAPDQVRRLAADALRPAHFFVGSGLRLEMVHVPNEELSWEIFHGRLLDRTQTNRRQTFEAWSLYLAGSEPRPPEPVLSLKLDAHAGQLHVVRAIECHVWEAYDAGDNVILSRETRRWVRELAGTIELARFTNDDDLRDEIICKVFQAVMGCSRLPLTSIESPLPQFSLGQLAYFYRLDIAAAEPLRSYRDLVNLGLTDELALVEKAKLLETLLHAVPWQELDKAAELLMARRHALEPGVVSLLGVLFNEASLSPYTDLVDKTLALARVLVDKSYSPPGDLADFLGMLLRQLNRHLTAYDLVTFHHRGANYPDALVLDAVLKTYLEVAERQPGLFLEAASDPELERRSKRLRRRALRQGWLLRRRYEGHLVPDAPTSEGENTRVLPPPYVRVPEDQILFPHKRKKRLYEGDPLDRYLGEQAAAILRQSIHDLEHLSELRELGLAIFVDRPLDGGKGPLEPDQTPLLSYHAFSRSIARRRLRYLAEELGLIPDGAEYERYQEALDGDPGGKGIAVDEVAPSGRRGSVSLVDARKAADDFVLLRTTASSAALFQALYSFDPVLQRYRLDDLGRIAPTLMLRCRPESGWPGLMIYDGQWRKRLELDFDPQPGYQSRGGIEFPASPMRVVRVWEGTGDGAALCERDLRTQGISLTPMVSL